MGHDRLVLVNYLGEYLCYDLIFPFLQNLAGRLFFSLSGIHPPLLGLERPFATDSGLCLCPHNLFPSSPET